MRRSYEPITLYLAVYSAAGGPALLCEAGHKDTPVIADHVCCGCHEKEVFEDMERLRALLYECIVELHCVQEAPGCHSCLCATSKGQELIHRGMELLGVKDLSKESL